MVINKFRGEYSCFSNMDEHPITFNGLTYRNSEACFQAQKCSNDDERLEFTLIDGYTAKRLGRRIKCDMKSWHEVRDYIMFAIQLAKFTQYEEFRTKLLDTGDAEIIEGNDHGDSYWGVNNKTGNGLNKLGKILMVIRDRELQKINSSLELSVGVVETPLDTIIERVKAGYYLYDPPSEINLALLDVLQNPNCTASLRIVVTFDLEKRQYRVVKGADVIAAALKVQYKFNEVPVGFIPVIHTNTETYEYLKSKGVDI